MASTRGFAALGNGDGAKTLCRRRSVNGVHEIALLTAVSFEMPANHNVIRVDG